jgi:hypothetical protein
LPPTPLKGSLPNCLPSAPELRGTASVVLLDAHRSNLIYCVAIAPDPAPERCDVSEAVTPEVG